MAGPENVSAPGLRGFLSFAHNSFALYIRAAHRNPFDDARTTEKSYEDLKYLLGAHIIK
jgi:hypothetical protein